MIPNSITHITPKLLIRQLFVRQAASQCEEWFRQYTGKKHILLTSSCRTALFLAYAAAGRSGEVITSPLTCTSAIDPIIAAGLRIRFCDINPRTLLMNTEKATELINDQTSCIQVIHHGGLRLDIERLKELTEGKNLLVVEDCGQAFSVGEATEVQGSFYGDVACFSMIKNGFGLGGGVLATDDEQLFVRALEIQESWRKTDRLLLFFRSIRSVIEERKHQKMFFLLYRWLLRFRPFRSQTSDPCSNLRKAMRKPSALFFRIFLLQTDYFSELHNKRRHNARSLLAALESTPVAALEGYYGSDRCAFDKFFCLLPVSESERVASAIHQLGVEARHLESRFGSFRQPRLDDLPEYASQKGLNDCPSYFDVHDKVLHLPLHERMKKADYEYIADALNQLLT